MVSFFLIFLMISPHWHLSLPTHPEDAPLVMASPPLPPWTDLVLEPCSYDIRTASQDSIWELWIEILIPPLKNISTSIDWGPLHVHEWKQCTQQTNIEDYCCTRDSWKRGQKSGLGVRQRFSKLWGWDQQGGPWVSFRWVPINFNVYFILDVMLLCDYI